MANLRAYDPVGDLWQSLAHYFVLYDDARQPHSALGTQAPDMSYFSTLPAIQRVACSLIPL